MGRRWARWAAPMFVAALAAGGCASPNHDVVTMSTALPTTSTTAPPVVPSSSVPLDPALDQYDAQANSVCIRYERLLGAVPEPPGLRSSSPPTAPQVQQIAAWADSLAALFDSEVKALHTIPEPPADASQINGLLLDIGDTASELQDAADELRAGEDDTGFSDLEDAFGFLDHDAFAAVGMDFCGPPS